MQNYTFFSYGTQKFGGRVSNAIEHFRINPKAHNYNIYIFSQRKGKYYASFLFDDDIKFIEVESSIARNGGFFIMNETERRASSLKRTL